MMIKDFSHEFISFCEGIVKSFNKAINAFKDWVNKVWGSIKEIVSTIEETCPTPIHPAFKQRVVERYILRSQVIMNKPKRIHARTTC